jgi:hypothetical protein
LGDSPLSLASSINRTIKKSGGDLFLYHEHLAFRGQADVDVLALVLDRDLIDELSALRFFAGAGHVGAFHARANSITAAREDETANFVKVKSRRRVLTGNYPVWRQLARLLRASDYAASSVSGSI